MNSTRNSRARQHTESLGGVSFAGTVGAASALGEMMKIGNHILDWCAISGEPLPAGVLKILSDQVKKEQKQRIEARVRKAVK